MRRLILSMPISHPNPSGSVRLYGPLADLSAVDTSAPTKHDVMVARHVQPAHNQGAHNRSSRGSVKSWAGHNRAPYNTQALYREVTAVPVSDTREWEYGVIPLGVATADELGGECGMVEVSALVISSPSPLADAALTVVGGMVQINTEEWPNG